MVHACSVESVVEVRCNGNERPEVREDALDTLLSPTEGQLANGAGSEDSKVRGSHSRCLNLRPDFTTSLSLSQEAGYRAIAGAENALAQRRKELLLRVAVGDARSQDGRKKLRMLRPDAQATPQALSHRLASNLLVKPPHICRKGSDASEGEIELGRVVPERGSR